jgi:hypothetical protein
VRDGAFPAKYDTTTLMINVLDMNDNAPVFQINSYLLRVPEGKAFVGIHKVAAVDVDTDKNGEVRYFITGKYRICGEKLAGMDPGSSPS